MNEEETQRKMDFIIEQQAQFAIDIQKLQESQAEVVKKHNHLTEAITAVVGMIGKLTQAQEKQAEAQEKLAQETAERFKNLTTKQAETDERLNIFINVVERYIGERHSNGQQSPDDKS